MKVILDLQLCHSLKNSSRGNRRHERLAVSVSCLDRVAFAAHKDARRKTSAHFRALQHAIAAFCASRGFSRFGFHNPVPQNFWF
jgi:hypothetical protein